MTSRHQAEVIIAIRDPGIRSALAARLGAGGELLIVVDSVEQARVSDSLRDRATLIVDAADHAGDYVEVLRSSGWSGPIVVLTAAPLTARRNDGVAYLPRNAEAVSVAAVLQMWRARGGGSMRGD